MSGMRFDRNCDFTDFEPANTVKNMDRFNTRVSLGFLNDFPDLLFCQGLITVIEKLLDFPALMMIADSSHKKS